MEMDMDELKAFLRAEYRKNHDLRERAYPDGDESLAAYRDWRADSICAAYAIMAGLTMEDARAELAAPQTEDENHG
jgi:hypothetical protein